MSTPSPSLAPPNPDPWTVRRVLEWTTAHLKKHGSDTPRLDAEVLLAHARGCQRIQLYTAYDEPLSDEIRGAMRELVQRRAKAEPVAYLVGRREFFSLTFDVSAAVLIPRPDTETLVVELLDCCKTIVEPRILELGVGSGCVLLSALSRLPGARGDGVDLSAQALQVAVNNAERLGLTSRVAFWEGDLFAPVPVEQRWHVIVSNPPYIPTAEIAQLEADVRLHEPRLALDGGADGLDVIRRLIHEAPARLLPEGYLLMEFSPEQAAAIGALFAENAAWEEPVFRKDMGGRLRVAVARVRAE